LLFQFFSLLDASHYLLGFVSYQPCKSDEISKDFRENATPATRMLQGIARKRLLQTFCINYNTGQVLSTICAIHYRLQYRTCLASRPKEVDAVFVASAM